ncbi:MAG: ADP-dependent NAD(P)H-hydrate dehydratase / NAD(P)H-hydrate epimerase [Thermoproteota archaeon]|nr:ADP-dependent NAD(P)H-hydrate dehydratase / NAD(P)H-hydrate epimerase [Thermoproteota archaeon]
MSEASSSISKWCVKDLSFQGEDITGRIMAALEANAEYFGVSTLQMMENAGSSVAKEITARFKSDGTRVVIVAGTGGNGGDGMVAARHLAYLGFRIELILIGRPEDVKREIVQRNWMALQFIGDSVKTVVATDSALIPKLEGEVIVDALLGTGAKGRLRPPILEAVKAINEASGFKVAIDLPTGVDSDSGEIQGEAVKADLTVALHRSKTGLSSSSAKSFIGELVVAGIGVPREAEYYIGPGDVFLTRKPRLSDSHKGDYGRLLVVGGSETYAGAPTLAAMAAMRVGVDLVFLAAPSATAHDIASFSPSLITLKLKGDHLSSRNIAFLRGFVEKSSAVILGPGLGLHKDTIEAVRSLVDLVGKMRIPLLLDADGLKAFAESKRHLDFPVVFTPHAGEYKILVGEEPPRELEKKIEHVRRSAKELNSVILLKGAVDVVSDGVRLKLNKVVHNPGMTVGGTGDVLSGIVGAFLSQGFNPFESAAAGVFINGAAGDFVVQEKGYHMLAADLIDWIPRVMDNPMSHIQVRKKST